MSLRDDLIRHEALRLFPYRDSEGLLTIGVGRNIEERGISREEALYLLDNDIRDHTAELIARFPVVDTLDPPRRDVLINMAFNLGIPRLAGFKRMWAAIERGITARLRWKCWTAGGHCRWVGGRRSCRA